MLLGVALAIAACHSSPKGAEPSEASLALIGDPYVGAPRRGEVPDVERAAAVLDSVAKSLGYGAAPAAELRRRQGEAWVSRTAMFLSHGGAQQLAAAWIDVRSSLVEAYALPAELKFKVRQGEARVLDYEAAKIGEEKLRKAALAEIAWTFKLLAEQRPDGGHVPL